MAAKAKITMSVQEKVSDFSSLFKAMKKCKKGVSWKRSVIEYTQHGLYRIYLLKQDMDRGTYKPIEGYKFTIYEPKRRDIVSTRFRDRVPQRSLVDNYLYDEVCQHFVPQNAACQKNKGTDYARNLLKANLHEFYKRHGTDGYILKIDVKSFFGSIAHDKAKAVMRNLITDDWAHQMVVDEIDSHSAEVGIGLGSQLNQLIALAMLNGLDHKLLEDCTILYDRYMDDMLIIHHSKERLNEIKQMAAEELERNGLRLNRKKTQIVKITQPVHFLGFSYKLHETGRVTMKVLPAKISKRRRKLKKQIALVKAGVLTIEQVKAFYKGGRDHLKKGTRSGLAKIDKFYKTQMEELESWMKSSN